MANVADRRADPMDNFFKGIAALQQGAETLTRYEMFNKELDLKKSIADMEYSKKQGEIQGESIKAQAYAQQVAGLFGYGEPSPEFLKSAGLKPETWTQMTKEERQTARNIETTGAKHIAKAAEIDLKAKWDITEQNLKDVGMDERQIRQIKANFAIKNVSPGKAAVGAAAGEEVVTPTADVIQPFEELVNIPGLFGAKKLTAVDLINKIGTKKLNEIDSRIGLSPLEYIRKLNKAVKESPKDKDKLLKRLIETYPEIESIMK